jgi:hypothetical protein
MLPLQLARRLRFSIGFLAAILAFSPAVFAAPPSRGTGAKAQKSLDEALLEDLDAGTRRPAAPREQPPKKVKHPPDDDGQNADPKEPRKRSLDDELLGGLEGEDVSMGNNPANENPLMRLNERMKQVERRIAQTHSDEKTQRLQKEISEDLSKLVAQLEQQCRQCKKPGSSAGRQQTSQSKPASKPSQQPGEKPASDSTSRTQERGTAKIDPARLQEMLKDVWGHLPLHLRQQMEQSANEEFLPKYEAEISEYYRSLVGGRKERK